jgi:hypothetical protein
VSPRQSRTLVIVLGGVIGALTGYKYELGFIAAAALGAVVLALYRPYALAIGLFGWAAVRAPVIQALPQLFWAINAAEAGVLALVLLAALLRGSNGHWLFARRWPWVAAGLFTLAATVSAVINGSSLLQVAMGLRGHFLVPLTALAAAILVDGTNARKFAVRMAIVVALAQVPIGLAQFVLSGTASKGPDIVFGTLGAGGSNNLGFLMLGAMAAFAGEYVRTRRVPYMLGVLVCAPVFVFASSRLGLLMSPAVMLTAVVFARPERGRGLGLSRRTLVAVVALASAFALVAVYYEYRPLTVQRDLSPQYFLTDQGVFIERGVSRMGYLYYGSQFVDRYARVPALGTGPASASSGAAANIGGALAYEFSYGLQLFGNSNTLDPTRPGFVPLPPELASNLVEYGWIGTSLFMAFAVGIGLTIWQRLQTARFPGLTRPSFALWFGLYTVGTLYTSAWEGFSIIAVGFWWWTIVLTSGRRRVE